MSEPKALTKEQQSEWRWRVRNTPGYPWRSHDIAAALATIEARDDVINEKDAEIADLDTALNEMTTQAEIYLKQIADLKARLEKVYETAYMGCYRPHYPRTVYFERVMDNVPKEIRVRLHKELKPAEGEEVHDG